jgi:hypothetical protein
VGLYYYTPIVARQQINKNVTRASFICGPCRKKGQQAISSHQNLLLLRELTMPHKVSDIRK